MKIVFTSVGRRVELVQAFRRAADAAGIQLMITGADASEDAPALFYCDERVKSRLIRDEEYVPQLLELCGRDRVDCLIPTIDTDLLLMARHKKQFEAAGTRVMISETDKVALCRDKNHTAGYFRSLGLKAPHTVNSVKLFAEGIACGAYTFPAFIKPKDGSSSINAYKTESLDELQFYGNKLKDYIIQPFIKGKEYTIDIFCDFEGNPIYITPRERVEVRSGEVLKTRIVQDEVMIGEMMALVQDYRPCGQITVQLIREEATGENYYIEINPRFGGGAPLSIMAGADSAAALLHLLSGKTLSYQERAAVHGRVYSRFDQSICVKG